jgi:hypothetical protein
MTLDHHLVDVKTELNSGSGSKFRNNTSLNHHSFSSITPTAGMGEMESGLVWLFIGALWLSFLWLIIQDAVGSEPDRATRLTAYANIAIAFFSAVTLAVAIFAYSVSHGQLRAMQGQLDIMELDQRPWVFVASAQPIRDLSFVDGKAYAAIELQLKNAGRRPARFASIEGEFIIRGNSEGEVRKGWGACERAKRKPVGQFLAGTAVFPGQDVPQAHVFTMSSEDIAKWKVEYERAASEQKPFTMAPIIVGCVDYVFEADNRHHQTRFVFEADRHGPDSFSFLAIDPNGGNVPLKEFALAKNPALADDPD